MTIKNYYSVLIFIIPVSYVIGVGLTEFFVFLSLVLFLINYKNWYQFKDLKTVFLLFFSFYIFFNSIFQITGDEAKNLKLSSIFHFRFVIFSLAICYFCKISKTTLNKKFFFTFFICVLIILLDSIFQFFFSTNLIGFDIIRDGRISSFFQDELILGSFLVRILPIILYFIFYYNFDLNKNKITLVFFFSLYLIAIFISGERTAFFLLFFIILSILFFFKDLKKIITYSIISLLIFAVLSSYFNLGKQNPADRMFIKTFNQIIEVNNNEKDNNKKKILYRIYSKDHEGHIKLAIHLFNEKKLFGIGPKGFRYYCRKVNYSPEIGVCTTHPHNIFIQILSELGLVGIIFYFIAFIFILYHFFKSVFKKKFSPNFLAFYSISLGLIINLFPFIPSGNFFNNWISIILYYNIGIYLYSFKKCISK